MAMASSLPKLVAPAGNLASLKAALEQGADAVYIGLRDQTNARHFAGLNFTADQLRKAVTLAQAHHAEILVAINTLPDTANRHIWLEAIDLAAEAGANAVILADIGLFEYATTQHPDLPRHLSVQGSATSAEAIDLFWRHFGIRRAVLPRVLTFERIRQITQSTPVEIEIFGFGSLCVMAEGRCLLSWEMCGESPNRQGACSSARFVAWEQTPEGLTCRLNHHLLERYQADEAASYPTVCKGRYLIDATPRYAIESPLSLNLINQIPNIVNCGAKAIKLEGRQRTPAYVATVTRIWRAALDAYARHPEEWQPDPEWGIQLEAIGEGKGITLGAYADPDY
jgi:putative protease